MSKENNKNKKSFDNSKNKKISLKISRENHNNKINIYNEDSEIFKNGNIDQIYDYINLNDSKKKSHKKKKNLKKNDNNIKNVEFNCDENNQYDKEVERFKKIISINNVNACHTIKIKPVFSRKWIENLMELKL